MRIAPGPSAVEPSAARPQADFADAERPLRGQVAGERILSFVPNPEQRLWRTMTRSKHQLTHDRVRLQSQIESLLEEARIKLSTIVSDLLGVSSRRMLQAIAAGETDPARLAALADSALQATAEQLQDALSAAAILSPLHREILGLFLARLELVENHTQVLEKSIAQALQEHAEAVQRLAEAAGYGVNSAHQVIAEVGPSGSVQEQSQSQRQPGAAAGSHAVANAAVKSKAASCLPQAGGPSGAPPGDLGNRPPSCRLTWKLLHEGVSYIEKGTRPNPRAVRKRANRLLRDLRALRYQVEVTPPSQLMGRA